MATGQLSVAKTPELPEQDCFRRTILHTARWPHEGVDLRGKRVGVTGTGSSGTQSIPLIPRDAEHLTVFQRTPDLLRPGEQRHDQRCGGRRGQGALRGPPWARPPLAQRVGVHPHQDLGPRRGGGRTARALRGAVADGWLRVRARLPGPDARRGGERHGRRVRPRQDRREGERPRDQPAARAHRLPLRRQAAPGRLRLPFVEPVTIATLSCRRPLLIVISPSSSFRFSGS